MSQVRFGLVALLIAASATVSAAQTAIVGGTVYRDSAQHPLGGAEITIQPANRVTRSNYLGEFRFDRLPPGRYAVSVRYLGFAPFVDSVAVANGEAVEREFVLTQTATMLDSQRVVARKLEDGPFMAEFEERRKGGIGHFIGTDELRKVESGRPLINYIASTIPGLQTYRPNRKERPQDWFIGGGSAHGGTNRANASSNCAVALYVDGNPYYIPGVTHTPEGVAPDISGWSADEFSGVEYYADGAGAPAKYNTSNSGCGVLLLWRRYRR